MENVSKTEKNAKVVNIKEYLILITGFLSIVSIGIFSLFFISYENYLFIGMFLPFSIMIYSLKQVNEKNIRMFLPIVSILGSTVFVLFLSKLM